MTNYRTQARLFLWIIPAVCLVLGAGLRAPTDPDYLAYMDLLSGEPGTSLEPAFRVLSLLTFGGNQNLVVVLLVTAAISIGIKCYILQRKSPFWAFSMIIYAGSTYWTYDFVAIRQGLAISFLWIVVFYANTFLRCLSYAAAVLSHYSAAMFFPILIVRSRAARSLPFNLLAMLIFAIAGYLGAARHFVHALQSILLLNGGVWERIDIYLQQPGYVFPTKLVIVYIVVALRRLAPNSDEDIVTNTYFFGVLFCLVFSDVPEFAFRIRGYVSSLEPFLYAIWVKSEVQRVVSKQRKIALAATMMGAITLQTLWSSFELHTDILRRGFALVPFGWLF